MACQRLARKGIAELHQADNVELWPMHRRGPRALPEARRMRAYALSKAALRNQNINAILLKLAAILLQCIIVAAALSNAGDISHAPASAGDAAPARST